MNINKNATQVVGLDAIYCRLVPEDKSEDVIVQEYTLFGYECPKNIKVVTANTDYQVGNFMIDMWGMHQDVPVEIDIDITTWQSIYGKDTMPLKGDFILVELLRKPYEISTSQVKYTIGNQPTSFRCMLTTWKHNANRKEPEPFTISIDELTDSQQALFGDTISKEVADAVVEAETAYNVETTVDPYKDTDLNALEISDDLQGENGNTFATAYYNFINMDTPLIYKSSAVYDPAVEENHWIFSCWFKTDEGIDDIQSGSFKFIDKYMAEKDYWYFHITSGMKINIGDEVSIYRGSMVKLNGIIVREKNDTSFSVKIPSSECYQASSKIANWWTNGVWKVQKPTQFNLIKFYDDNDLTFGIQITGNHVIYDINGKTHKVNLTKAKSLIYEDWHYIAIDVSPKSIRTILVRNKLAATNKYTNKVLIDETSAVNIKGFSFDHAEIDNTEMDFCMTNIRLYENQSPLGENYKLDMYSQVTKNASKAIIVDSPTAANKMPFVTPVR